MGNHANPLSSLIFLITLLSSVTAFAANFTVDSTTDAVDANIGNGTCATAANECTLRAAVQEANTAAGPHTITLPAGLFPLTVAGAGENLAATGDLDILQEVTVKGAGKDQTFIDGQLADRIFDVQAAVPVTLQDLTVQSGFALAGTGGGMLSPAGAPLTLTNVSFQGNVANDGGAIVCADALTISDSMFTDNYAQNINGGAIFRLAPAGTVNISNSVFRNNTVGTGISGGGGAIASISNTAFTISDTIFESNSAYDTGGCVAVIADSIDISDTQFLDCRAGIVDDGSGPNGDGGALYALVNTATISGSTFQWNTSTSENGAAFIAAMDTVNITGSNFNMNGAGEAAGGLHISMAPNGTTLTDTNIQSNTVYGTDSGAGGGVHFEVTGPVTLTNVLIDKNTARVVGGAIFETNKNVTANGLTISNNSALNGQVGGAYFSSDPTADMTFNNLVVDGNSGLSTGAGMVFVIGNSVTIENSTISNNVSIAGQGAGIFAAAMPGGLTVNNATFSGNFAGAAGGGLYTQSDATLNNTTFAYNASPLSGGDSLINAGANVTVSNSVFAYGQSGTNCVGAAITSGDYNIDDDGSCGFAMGNDLMVDPLLDSLADNGGPVYTHNLQSGSPAIDSANPATCESDDARGYSRPQDGDLNGTSICDRGALELIFDCNNNGINDINDIATGTSADCDNNDVPDSCQNDADSDGTIDSCEECDNDPNKTNEDICPCGILEQDLNSNGAIDCEGTAEAKALAKTAKKKANKIKYMQSNTAKKAKAAIKAAKELVKYVQDNSGNYDLAAGKTEADLLKKAKQARKKVKKLKSEALTGSQSDYDAAKKAMKRAFKKFNKLFA